MNINFNAVGKEYLLKAQTTKFPYFRVFENGKHVTESLMQIDSDISSSGLNGSKAFKEKLASIVKYTDQINGELIDCIVNNKYNTEATDEDGNKMYTYNLFSIGIDYNTFIYHSKSALDTLFNFIYANFGKPNKAKKEAKKMRDRDNTIIINELFIFELYVQYHSDQKVKDIGRELAAIKPFIIDIIERGSRNSLRNILTHQDSVDANLNACFNCFEDTEGNMLLVDADIYGYPLINSLNTITEKIVYFIIKSLSIIVNSNLLNSIDNYNFSVASDCPIINYRDYLDETSTDELQIVTFNESGVLLSSEKVNKTIYTKTIKTSLLKASQQE